LSQNATFSDYDKHDNKYYTMYNARLRVMYKFTWSRALYIV